MPYRKPWARQARAKAPAAIAAAKAPGAMVSLSSAPITCGRVMARRGNTKRVLPLSAVRAPAISVSLPAPLGPTTRTRVPLVGMRVAPSETQPNARAAICHDGSREIDAHEILADQDRSTVIPSHVGEHCVLVESRRHEVIEHETANLRLGRDLADLAGGRVVARDILEPRLGAQSRLRP